MSLAMAILRYLLLGKSLRRIHNGSKYFQDSQFPDNFTQFLNMNPGPPLEEPQWEGRHCSRRFEHFKISVNLEDENSATWSDY